jgi:hypothetical protein
VGLLQGIVRAIAGVPYQLDAVVLARYPELGEARYRVGGLPPRVGGWCLGASTVAGITVGRTVWLAPDASLTPRLLLHELAHVRQWRADPFFAWRYVWQCLRLGYHRNAYERAARDEVARALGDDTRRSTL